MNNDEIKILITGDFAPRLRVNEAIARGDYASLFGDLIDDIRNADIAITNLESPLCDTSTPIRKTGPNLMSPTKSIEALKYAGFGLATLANNHLMDQGVSGLKSTIETCEKAGVEYVGAGMNLQEARRVKFIECKGKKIAFINCCENEWSTTFGEEPGANPLDEVSVYYQIQDAKSKADYTILIIHGGHETYEYPSPRMKKLYRWFIDLGVDAVIGHHTHCYSGREEYKGKPIVYSLGNFLFDINRQRSSWNKGVATLLCIMNGSISIKLIPFEQCGSSVGIKKLEGGELVKWVNEDNIKINIILDDNLLSGNFEGFIRQQMPQYDSLLEPWFGRMLNFFRRNGLFPKMIKGRTALLYINLIRNESHRDIVLSYLKKVL